MYWITGVGVFPHYCHNYSYRIMCFRWWLHGCPQEVATVIATAVIDNVVPDSWEDDVDDITRIRLLPHILMCHYGFVQTSMQNIEACGWRT